MPEREKTFFQTLHGHVKKHWLTVSFLLGFITDFIMLNRVDGLSDNLILLGYVTLTVIFILLFYSGVAERWGTKTSRFFRNHMPKLMQYALGGLLSGMFIFYGRSGDWINGLPFLLIIVAVVIGNETVHKRSDRLVFHLVTFYIGLFSYLVLVLPVIFGVMGDFMFTMSGFVSLILITIVIQLVYRIVPNFLRINLRRIILVIGIIYIAFNSLYFTSAIPPIPLSLSKLSMAHSVTKVDNGSYRVVSERQPWYTELPFLTPTLHLADGSLSCFARVYAPAKIHTDIYHRWEYKNTNGDWVQKSRIQYPISGVNPNGYRGYTTITANSDGLWRCSVETARGQVLGRTTVRVQLGGTVRSLVTRTE
jgi:hypothetical protein